MRKQKQKVVGYRAYIINRPELGEFKYQLFPKGVGGNKVFTNKVRRFVEAIVRTCSSDDKVEIEIVER